MRMLWLSVVPLLCSMGCVHSLSASNLDRVHAPAFVSRIEENAGPRSTVFRDDNTYGGKLKKLEPKEADRRLTVKLTRGDNENSAPTITRFEVADTLRSTTLSMLPKDHPWDQTIDAARVASTLQNFLVEEVPANAPDYELLKALGADAVVEFVVEEYGMRSEDGRAGPYVVGYGRMFMLEGGGNIWFRSFRADAVQSKQPHVDPFKVAKNPRIFKDEMTNLLKAVSEVFAKDLTPADRSGSNGGEPDSKQPKKNQKRDDDELPAPDPI